MDFQLEAPFAPSGDQPEAIEALVKGVKEGMDTQVLLGATGTGKTFTIAQATDQVEETRPVFRAGYEDFLFLRDALKHEDVNILSMGMTHDYWIAVEEGANEIRVGSALFGARDYTLKF